MKRRLFILIAALVALHAAWPQQVITARRRVHSGAAPVWTFVQAAANFSCTANPCSVTFTSPETTGSVIVAGLASASAGDTITAVSDGGNTFNLCASSGCQVTNATIGSGDVAYSVTGVGGATVVNITDAASNPEFVTAIEVLCTANCGTTALDAVPNSFGNSTSCATCTAAGFPALAGTSDVIVQMMNFNNAPLSSPTGGYVALSTAPWIYRLNATVGTAPSVNQASAGPFLATGVAIR
jgi:hypothetical protein